MSIYIFSRPVHSGKTTALQEWCANRQNILGILMPDINGNRKIYDLETKTVFDIQCTDPSGTPDQLITVGRFHFYAAAFDKANAILMAALDQSPDWLVIDEAGKLELEGNGFYASVKKAVELYSNEKRAGNLLIAVRENLLGEVTGFFEIQHALVIHQLESIP